MIINRRSKAIEAMNYCERHNIDYQLTWSFTNQYRLAVPFSEQRIEIEYHLEQWERDQNPGIDPDYAESAE